MFRDCFKIRVSARGVIIHDDKILLNCFGEGVYYNIPGGGIEKGETVKQAVVREVMEETGLTVTADELVFVLDFVPKHEKCEYGHDNHMSLYIKCVVDGDKTLKKPTIPDINPDDPKLISVPKWVSIGELNDINLVPKVNKQLITYMQTGLFSPLLFEEN
ncbi:MAG: NUDIX domain-containing protein [Defluviitaleaceae bacterium]|nr:NUDIX domain-containing protein [Defluviitaleaceae bacterium]